MAKDKDEALRLSCIRQVIDSNPGKMGPEILVEKAQIVYDWVKGKETPRVRR